MFLCENPPNTQGRLCKSGANLFLCAIGVNYLVEGRGGSRDAVCLQNQKSSTPGDAAFLLLASNGERVISQ